MTPVEGNRNMVICPQKSRISLGLGWPTDLYKLEHFNISLISRLMSRTRVVISNGGCLVFRTLHSAISRMMVGSSNFSRTSVLPNSSLWEGYAGSKANVRKKTTPNILDMFGCVGLMQVCLAQVFCWLWLGSLCLKTDTRAAADNISSHDLRCSRRKNSQYTWGYLSEHVRGCVLV